MKKRVYILFNGGLGNQLFQYSYGVYLEEIEPNIELIFDCANYQDNTIFQLSNFCISNNNYVRYYKAKTRIGGLVSRCFMEIYRAIKYRKVVAPKDSIEYFEAPRLVDRTCLRGYWQNSAYYVNIVEKMKSMFVLRQPSQCYRKVAEKIEMGHYCAVHVRRGDYATFYDNSILPKSYYLDAIEQMNGLCSRYLVFSDDVEWCKQNFPKDKFEFVEKFGTFQDYEELMLMSKCEYHIIANSSFSWWGAYLSNSKKVICPYYSRWDRRFYMPSWHGLEVEKTHEG